MCTPRGPFQWLAKFRLRSLNFVVVFLHEVVHREVFRCCQLAVDGVFYHQVTDVHPQTIVHSSDCSIFRQVSAF